MERQPCPLFKLATSYPTQIGLMTEKEVWNYKELHAAVNNLCLYLKAQGIQEHQKVAFIAITHINTILLFCALFRLKAIACPLSTRLPQEQIESHLQRLKQPHFIDPEQLPLNLSSNSDPAFVDLDTLATFLFTSGSSGTPKIACHSFGNHYYNALGALEALKLNSASRYLLSLPLFHISGISILFRIWLSGGVIVLSSLTPLEAIKNHLITHLSLVPTQLYRLLQNKMHSTPPPSLRCLLLGGAPISQSLLQLTEEYRWPVYTTYGMTEASSMITLKKILPFREIQIRNQEIFIRGKTLFQGYWDSTKEKIVNSTEEGWFATRDLGRFNSEGELEIIGRKDRQFISGGENIQPEEIERALCTLPGILAAHVKGVDDLEFGKRPLAYIEDNTGAHTLNSIQEGLTPLLPRFKHPVQVLPFQLISDLPKLTQESAALRD